MGTRFMRTSCRGVGRSAQWHDRDSTMNFQMILFIINKFHMPSTVKIPR